MLKSRTVTKYKREHYKVRSQLLEQYFGDEPLVDAIIAEKTKMGPPHCIPHPDCPSSGHKAYLALADLELSA